MKYPNLKIVLTLGVVVLTAISCERELSDEAVFATFPKTGDIFTDAPVGLGSDFYFPFLGSKATAFSVDESEGYQSSASIRIDVPNANDPEGNFAGAIFRIDGAGRNLTGFDALTFWAKASQGVTIGEIGFGQDFLENKYQVTRNNISLGTNWAKYVIPIPDPSKLVEERGMLWYAAGGVGPVGQETGYTFWLDEVKFEKLGTLAQPQPKILFGADIIEDTFLDITIELAGLTQTFNTASGQNVTVTAKPSYFNFESSDIEVARVSELGVVTVVDTGEATISATLANVAASGSLALNVVGPFDSAPVPQRDPNNVISVFSDAYQNINVDFFNGFFGGQTTLGGAIDVAGDNVLRYTNLNFVTTQFSNPTVDASEMTHLHVNIKVEEPVQGGDAIVIELGDFGADGVFGGPGSDDSAGGAAPIDSSTLIADQWITVEIPLNSFTNGTGGGFSGLSSTSNLAQISFVSSNVSSILVDNIYLYKE
ncbi:Ig-like domain-containing protein [Sungkyunkwania multivorans]|uniref:Ig-like domain-containing protein n=1 Tax=Sungkyunkwania multivorans TaxID=1173618 RepID=A0ABW3CYQ8_9FLAO